MATKKKMLQAAAGSAGGGGLETAIEEVFSTYLYTGGTAQEINNGIDLDTEGGMVWIKRRETSGYVHQVFDTERTSGTYGTPLRLSTNLTSPEDVYFTTGEFSWLTDGFDLNNTDGGVNGPGGTYASWTFRKAPRFFDVVTWVGNGSSKRQIPHNLGSTPGAIFVKVTSHGQDWSVYHRELEATAYYNQPENIEVQLNTATAAVYDLTAWGGTQPTDTHFTVGTKNNNGYPLTYVAYLFAHDPLGPSEDGSDGLIACGSYTGNGNATNGITVDVGFEPQFVMVKAASGTGDWEIYDTMRKYPVSTFGDGNKAARLLPNTSDAEGQVFYAYPTANGFTFLGSSTNQNASGVNYIYIAIRRGPMRVPESGTEVFALQKDDTGDGLAPAFRSSFPVDFALERNVNISGPNYIVPRLTAPNFLKTDNNQPENHGGAESEFVFGYNNGWNSTAAQSANTIAYMWGRAPGFCDVVCYSGDGVLGRTVSHNLGVVPEMMWIKRRDQLANWFVYHTGTDATAPEDYTIRLDIDQSVVASAYLNNTAPSSSDFTIKDTINASGGTYVAYLFASLSGVSKVGSYTGDGTSGRIIDCGFTSGARFILIRRINALGSWILWDSVRGIVDGNDSYIALDTTDAEVVTTDYIDPHASGFMVNNNVRTNTSGATYVFYAVA
jgi:hypothetical protein